MLMRILLLLLLLANVAYATWQAFQDEATKSVRSVSQPAGADIVLLDELCLRAGRFESEAEAAELVRMAAEFGYEAGFDQREGAPVRQYWVLLMGGNDGDDDALQTRLGEEGIESYGITEGELAGTLSVGIFSTREAAGVQLERVAALDLMPEIREVERRRNELWVQLSPAAEGELQLAALQNYLQGVGLVDVEENVCEMIAPLD